MKRFTADFETTTDPEDCRVWAYGICDIDNQDYFVYGNNIQGFINYLKEHCGQKCYFRNLKFDGEFIISYLLNNGWVHNKDSKNLNKYEFSTLISDKGQFYTLKLCFGFKGKHAQTIEIIDSLKIIPLSIEDTAKAFALPVSKLKIDYDEYRAPGHQLTPHEVEYLRGDVTIDAMALKTLFNQGLNKITQGGNALHDYKLIMGKKFEKYFPCPVL